jgi:DNA polymerase III alpha subunit
VSIEAGLRGLFTSERGAPFATAGFAKLVERAGEAAGFAFKAYPHMLRHACGFALAEWDKDDIDALKFMKVDVLGLGMLGCMRRAFDLLDKAKGLRLDLATSRPRTPLPTMIRKADTLGTFQIESRAQMAMLPRLKPKTFYISSSRVR